MEVTTSGSPRRNARSAGLIYLLNSEPLGHAVQAQQHPLDDTAARVGHESLPHGPALGDQAAD